MINWLLEIEYAEIDFQLKRGIEKPLTIQKQGRG
jgi:hypothetical protein